MPHTPLHRALGREASELTTDLFEEAVSKAIEETDSLDWKAALPEKGPEFAKDVAAMANSGGGLIVYGVKEVDGQSRPQESFAVSRTGAIARNVG